MNTDVLNEAKGLIARNVAGYVTCSLLSKEVDGAGNCSSSWVYACRKIIDPDDAPCKYVMKVSCTLGKNPSFAIHTRLHEWSDNIIPVLKEFTYCGHSGYIMPLCNGGNLHDYANSFENGAIPPEQTKSIGQQISSAIMEIHNDGYIHGNINPYNILISVGEGGDVKAYLSGFSKAVKSTGRVAHSSRGRYIPPEVVQGGAYSVAGDIWALGATLEDVCKSGSDRDLINLIQELHNDDPDKRMSLEEFLSRLFTYPDTDYSDIDYPGLD